MHRLLEQRQPTQRLQRGYVIGYNTPNIDRIAKERALFTDWYGQQICTAGRARPPSPVRWGPHRPA
jgi:hypothetical protein